MLMIANLPRYKCAKNYQNSGWFDKVIAKIKWCSFLTHMVFLLVQINLCSFRLFISSFAGNSLYFLTATL